MRLYLNKEFIAGLALVGLVGLMSMRNAYAVEPPPDELPAYQSPYDYTMEQNQLAQQQETEKIIKEAAEAVAAEPQLVSLGLFKISAYCPCVKCCGKSDGITASGATAQAGVTVAMNGVPFGTKLIIDGHQYEVQDRGGGLGRKIIDVYFNSHEEALNSGLWVDREVFMIVDAED